MNKTEKSMIRTLVFCLILTILGAYLCVVTVQKHGGVSRMIVEAGREIKSIARQINAE